MRLTLLFNVAVAFLVFTSCAAATDVSIRISNGKTVTLVKTGDVFDLAENERARVTTSGLFDDRERGRIFMRWVFGIQFQTTDDGAECASRRCHRYETRALDR